VSAGVLAHHPRPRDHLIPLTDQVPHQQAAFPGVGLAEGRQLLAEALDGGAGPVSLAEDDLVAPYPCLTM
jgi:hypothetical protein